MFFNGWEPIIRTLVVGVLGYIGLIVLLRFSGKRTLSKMSAFDLVVTVALGSILATLLLSKKVALAEGMTAFSILIFMQFVVTKLSVHSRRFSDIVKSDPQLLYYNGHFLHGGMKKERVLEVEILQAARNSGIGSLDQVDAVILETDGSFTVIKNAKHGTESTLTNVKK